MSANSNPESGTRRNRLRLAALGLSSAAVVGLVVGMNGVQADDPVTPREPTTAPGASAWSGYADLIEQVMPAVVGITAQRTPMSPAADESPRFGPGPEGFEEFFGEQGPDAEMFERFMERFFGDRGERGDRRFGMPQRPEAFPRVAAGSGFVVSEDGLIVTNNHVIDGASEVTVKLHDGTELTATVLGRDPDTDLALLQVESDVPLRPVEFADSDQVRVGDPAVAIGSPFGLGGTVTAGIVSANNRVIGAGRYDDFLQIDAPINRGNSGGPTFNLDGKVIGVNTAIHSPTGGNVGIGFAIPANLAVEVIDDLRDDGQVERGWLGVHIQALDEDLARSLGLEEAAGALVAQVMPDSPAAAAGLQQGDVIVRFGEQDIEDLRQLTRTVADVDPGTTVDVVVWRDEAEQTIEVEIAQMPSEDQVAMTEEAQEGEEATDTPKLGVSLARLTDEARQSLDLPAEVQGVVVTEVQPGSPAAEKGLRSGDVIVQADRKEVSDPDAISEAVQAALDRGDEAVLLMVKRGGQDRFVAVPLQRA